MAMPSLLHSGSPTGIAFNSSPAPPEPNGGGGAVALQQKMLRQRQLAVERQKAAAARQRLGVGVVAQTNPLAAVNNNLKTQAANTWQIFNDATGLEKTTENSNKLGAGGKPGLGAAGVAAVGAVQGDGEAAEEKKVRCPKMHTLQEIAQGPGGICDSCNAAIPSQQGLWACRPCNWCICRDCYTSRLKALKQDSSGRERKSEGNKTTGNSNGKSSIEEMLDGLDVEELVDQLTKGDTPKPTADDDQAVRGARERGPSGHARQGPANGRRAPRQIAEDEKEAGPVSGVWGVDAGLVVQGPPPKVVAVQGFEETMTDFSSPDRRGPGGRRPRGAEPEDRGSNTSPTHLRGLGGVPDDEEDDVLEQGAPPMRRDQHAAPTTPQAQRQGQTWSLGAEAKGEQEPKKKEGKRWWKPWENNGPGKKENEPDETEVCAFDEN